MNNLLTAAKQALEALVLCSGLPRLSALQPAIDNLRTAIEQAEKVEPVVKVSDVMMIQRLMFNGQLSPNTDEGWLKALEIYTHPAPAVPDVQMLITLFERYAAQRIMAHDHGNKYGDVDASEATWQQFRDLVAAPEVTK